MDITTFPRLPALSLLACIALLQTAAPAAADVRTPHGERCRDGFVWREAAPGDQVCVTPATREQAKRDNAAADSRRVPGAEFGPNACVQGFVWRSAFPGDMVCVTASTRNAAREDNAQADSRRAPSPPVVHRPLPAPRPQDPDACAQGYVWRSAATGDKVCVTSDARALAARENGNAAARRQPGAEYGPNACRQGFVWRSAFAGDMVCVSPDARERVKRENADGPARRARP